MAKHLLTKEELIKRNGPRCFLLSYDAGEEIKEEKLNEKREKIIIKHRKYSTNDFRKVIIRTLREGMVTNMSEVVETAIFFRDPRIDISVEKKLKFWEAKFDGYELDFYYIIVPALQNNNNPYFAQFPNSTLNKNFQKLVKEVLAEKKKLL